jgi:uncharacterized protein involved in exopolysaccharide biosynthesis
MDQEETIDLFEYWQVLVRRKRFIARFVGMAFLGSLLVSLLLPKVYVARIAILPPQPDMLGMSFGAQSAGGSGGSALGGLAGGLLGLKTPSDLWSGILKSRTVMDAIIDRFQLKTVFDVQTIYAARKTLTSRVTLLKGKEDIISIEVEDKDPKRAAAMATAFIEELDKFNKRQVMTSGGRMRAFVEKRLVETSQALIRAEDALQLFQETNKAVKLEAQSKTIIDAIGSIRGELMAKEVELQTMLSYATPNHPEAGILRTEAEELKQRLVELSEGKKSSRSTPKDIFIPTRNIPALGVQYARLLRDEKTQETLHTLLTQQFEMARIQEARDGPTVQVLDVATVPERAEKPNRVLIVSLTTGTAVFLAVLLALFLDFMGKSKEHRHSKSRSVKIGDAT